MSQCLAPKFVDRRRRDEPLGWSYIFGSVELYHNIMLSGLFVWGVLSIFGVDPPAEIFQTLPHAIYAVWTCSHLAVPATAWLGVLIGRGRRDNTRLQRAKWQLQGAGDSAACLMIATTGIAYAHTGDYYLTLLFLLLATFPLGLTLRDLEKSRKFATHGG